MEKQKEKPSIDFFNVNSKRPSLNRIRFGSTDPIDNFLKRQEKFMSDLDNKVDNQEHDELVKNNKKLVKDAFKKSMDNKKLPNQKQPEPPMQKQPKPPVRKQPTENPKLEKKQNGMFKQFKDKLGGKDDK